MTRLIDFLYWLDRADAAAHRRWPLIWVPEIAIVLLIPVVLYHLLS